MIHWLWLIPPIIICLVVGFMVGYMAGLSDDVEEEINGILDNKSRLN